MAYTITQAVAAAQRTFPDLQTARGVDLANQVHREILAFIPEAQRNLLNTITPISAQGEYSIGEVAFQVDFCVYVNSGAETPISGTTVETLDRSATTWRQDAGVASYPVDGGVVQFYTSTALISAVNVNVIGFYPKPAFTAGSIFVYGSQLQAADLPGSSSCLTSLLSSQVYVEGLRYYAATELRPEMAAAFKATYAEALATNRSFIRTRNGDVRGASKNDYNPRDGGYPVAH